MKAVGWVFTRVVVVLLQAALALGLLFLVDTIMPAMNTDHRSIWWLTLIGIALCFTLGSFLGGSLARSFLWPFPPHRLRLRLTFTALGSLLPLVVLVLLEGFRSGWTGVAAKAVINVWQPILVFAALWFSIASFYFPGWMLDRD